MTRLNDDVIEEIVSLSIDQEIAWEDLSFNHGSAKNKLALSTLRLVDTAFCRVVSPRLFRTVYLFAPGGKHPPLLAKRLTDMINSKLTGYFHNFVIRLPLVPYYGSSNLTNCRLNIEDLAALLPIGLGSFRNLKTIAVCCDISGCEQGHFTNDLRHQFDSCLLTALRYAPLRDLTSLHLDLLAAEDFKQLLSKTRGTRTLSFLMHRLQHLSVSFVDGTGGAGGSFGRQSQSYIQVAFPNARYETSFFNFIALAKNLRSLKISCPQYFDLDRIDRSNLQKLDSMELTCVKAKVGTLLSLLSPRKTSFKHLILQNVQLKSGTWHTIFRHLLTVPTFVAFQVIVSSYSADGESAQYRLRILPPMDDPQEVESLCFDDFFALDDLKTAVAKRRTDVGLPAWQN
ncbi:hypothetical protein JB92DRAFT_2827306 [Gautieria morchelliformis]|nr:hypothetical protein JB92DRAFT_2827306 [Gautieria morchelliformis]